MMVFLKYLCILWIIPITYEQLTEPGAECPEYSKGTCQYDKECPASSKHGTCGADKNFKPLVCCASSATTKVLNYYSVREFPERTQCGRSRFLNQIYNGDKTEIGEYPWTVALLYVATKSTTYGGVQCGGTLITEKFVLTAAHCVTDQTEESIRVLLGDWNITSDPDPFPGTDPIEYAPKVINASIDKIISHELYRSKTKRNDIALLRLENPVHFTDYVRPICLPSRDFPALASDDEVLVAGWGRTEHGSTSEMLLKATLHVLTNKACLAKTQQTEQIHETELCAANVDSDSCGGDSGGPLMKSYKDYKFNWFQVGIVGHGPTCSFGATASIYTRVSFFVDWILDKITPQSERDSPCITSDNENGSCVLVDQCPVLEQQYLQPGSSSEVELIRRSLCGLNRENRSDMICCKSSQINRGLIGGSIIMIICLQPGSNFFIKQGLYITRKGTNSYGFATFDTCEKSRQCIPKNAMEGSSCKTPKPELKDVSCVRITNCPALKDASKAAGEDIQKYQCGFDDELLVCCKTQDIVINSEPKSLEEFSSANIPNRKICGQIISDNTKSEYPWLAAVVIVDDSTNTRKGYRLRCTGSLINERFVLTAASCFDVERTLIYRILLGTGIADCYKTSNCPRSMQNLTVEQTILHPFYYPSYNLNDIALVRLGSNVVFNDYVSPICLPPPNLQPLRRGSDIRVITWASGLRRNTRSSKAYLWNAQSCIENLDSRTIHKQELCITNGTTKAFCNAEWKGSSAICGGASIVRVYIDQLGQNLFLEGIYLGSRNCYRRELNPYSMANVRISAYTNWILRTINETT